MKVLCIGHATYDITLPLDKFIKENTKTRLEGMIECGGGPANNAAYLLGKWDVDTAFLGIVGNDLYGHYIKEELDSVNVDTRYLEFSDKYKTTSSFILVNMKNGSRTILSYRSNKLKMNDVDIDFEPSIILIDGQEIEISKKMINKYPNAISIIDAGRYNDEIIDLCKMCDYIVCSKEFAKNVSNYDLNSNTYKDVYEKLKEKFLGKVIITLENEGCIYEDEGNIIKVDGLKVESLDTTGAGDIFHAAFTYGILKKLPLHDILKFSNIVAGLSTTRLGGKNSMFTLEEIKEQINEYK